MKGFIVVLILLFVVVSVAVVNAGPVDEAKAQISKEKHEALVSEAKRLLEKKAGLESQLAEIKKKLEQVDRGELPNESCVRKVESSYGTISGSTFLTLPSSSIYVGY